MQRSVTFAPYTALDKLHVRDAMSDKIVSCARDIELHEVARIMASQRTHSVLVEPQDSESKGSEWGVISDRDLVGAYFKPHAPAWSIAAIPTATVGYNATLTRALRLMGQHNMAHLVVVDDDEQAVGVISTADIVDAMSEMSEASEDAA
jgi:predicted transcriptional regulator